VSEARFESLVDQQIRAAQERGEFDDLPGKGKPLPGWGRPDDGLWWVRQFMDREGLPADGLLPTSLRLAREIERLPDKVATLPSEQAVREAVDDLNERIRAYLRMPSGPYVPLRQPDADEVVATWRVGREVAAGSPEPAGQTPGGRSSSWSARWRRWFGGAA
jgi:hypothetical protein